MRVNIRATINQYHAENDGVEIHRVYPTVTEDIITAAQPIQAKLEKHYEASALMANSIATSA